MSSFLPCYQDFSIRMYIPSMAYGAASTVPHYSPLGCAFPFIPSWFYLLKFCCHSWALAHPSELSMWEPACSLLCRLDSMHGFLLGSSLHLRLFLFVARATLEILIPDFVKQTSEEKPKDSEELEVSVVIFLC